jgi:hypothetical protein
LRRTARRGRGPPFPALSGLESAPIIHAEKTKKREIQEEEEKEKEEEEYRAR